jgi:hypothetical protein
MRCISNLQTIQPDKPTNKQQYKINLINMPMESGSFAQTHKIIEKMN